MGSSNVETFRRAHEAFNRRDFDAVVSAMADGFTYVDHARGMVYQGTEHFKLFMRSWTSAFSNASVLDASYIDGGDVVAAEFRGCGVNDGGMGPFRATGRSMDLPFCEIMRFDENGRIVSGGVYYDVMSLLTQLGIAATPAGSAG